VTVIMMIIMLYQKRTWGNRLVMLRSSAELFANIWKNSITIIRKWNNQ